MNEKVMMYLGIAMTALWAIATVLGALLPKESKLGQLARQWAADPRNMNLNTIPKENVENAAKSVFVAEDEKK